MIFVKFVALCVLVFGMIVLCGIARLVILIIKTNWGRNWKDLKEWLTRNKK